MGILLSDGDKFYVGMDVTKGGGDYADIYEVIDASAKAQSKKWMELLKQRANFVAWEWKDSKGIWEIRFDDNEWQELLKEVE